ncbi:hypothetical protein Taro_004058 [Colocasia esculenta]|uniref:Uncharacterized protein n=1 Tax=Colocasia esculenta TaxID=4460 RepID=A0A843TQK6_COLES|nr:hypothetical protein [Colocasia esculenta]
MNGLWLKSFFWVVLVTTQTAPAAVLVGYSWCLLPPSRRPDEEFQQKTERFWVFEEQSNRWVEISLPYDLTSCLNGSCTKVASIEMTGRQNQSSPAQENEKLRLESDEETEADEATDPVLPVRKGVSLTRMSEASIWVTGLSGSIYERFWNGVQWVIAPHELPPSAGHAISVFIINQTVLALSELGKLYQLRLNENTQPIWIESTPITEASNHDTVTEPSSPACIKSGVASNDGERLYFSTVNGLLLELSDVQTMRWTIHGRPPGGDVISIIDAAHFRPGVIFTLSSAGELYEFSKYTKPSWKKHIWSEAMSDVLLTPSTGCILHRLMGTHSLSLFLLSKDGTLVERRLNHRKWKWITHGAPKGQTLTAITAGTQTEPEEKNVSLFLTTATGFIFEYQIPKHSAKILIATHNCKVDVQNKQTPGKWANHMHPHHAKAARGIPGVYLQFGRMVIPLDDGRLGELHQSTVGSEYLGPNRQVNTRRKAPQKYEWSTIEAPETEGWNAEYCTDERGPNNCIAGMKDVIIENEPTDAGITTMTRRITQECQHYISVTKQRSSIVESEQNNFLTKSVDTNFHLRAMHTGRSFFIITESGSAFEYLYTENMWLWLRHEYSNTIKGAMGNYNGSLFLVDTYGNLLLRERNGTELSWINCTAMKRGRQVASGPPWDDAHGKILKITAEDSLFFVSKKGRLLQFTVALRKFKWKDCRHPPNTKIAYIVDQEVLRMNIVFVVGTDGRLYQYNKVTELWHQHCQSPHLVLQKSPGTAMRLSSLSLTGSLFMILENGGLVEYHWDSLHGWNWIEHGTPHRNMMLVGAPGPSFGGTQLLVVGSDGYVYQRYMDQKTWKWASYEFPHIEAAALETHEGTAGDGNYIPRNNVVTSAEEKESIDSTGNSCNEKVAPVRPIKFSEDSVIFQLQDGRLAELRRSDEGAEWEWRWARIIGTPSSPCLTGYWAALAS